MKDCDILILEGSLEADKHFNAHTGFFAVDQKFVLTECFCFFSFPFLHLYIDFILSHFHDQIYAESLDYIITKTLTDIGTCS